MIDGICLLCGNATGKLPFFCAPCVESLPLVSAACKRCGNPLTQSMTCGRCLQCPPGFASYLAAYWYQFPVDRLIVAAKFNGRLEILSALGYLFSQTLTKSLPDPLPQALVPVPLHRRRLFQRGYNQSIEIARTIASTLKLPLLVDACRRHRNTMPQSELAGKARRGNVKGAFSVPRGLAYKHIAIIDDVYTSGSTVEEMTDCLLRSGCERVDVWTFSRAVSLSLT